jgi:sugar O-acyltransferase (sialic acid O-acetyltransferase NeuD family)
MRTTASGTPPLVIFGVGGLAREIFGWIKASARASREYPVAAFVADGLGPAGEYCGVPVVRRGHFGAAARPRFIMAVSDPEAKARVCGELEADGWSAAQYIHETVLIGANVKVGRGMIACPFCTISSDAVIGDHVLINGSTLVGHDVKIGNFCSLLGRVSLNGGVVLGDHVLVGASATIFPGKKIGAGAIVGMGSVVFRNVAAGVTVVGNPASRLSA